MDNVEDNLPRGFSSIKPEKVELPNAPRAARGPDVSDDRIPKEPPFTAYIANLSYEVNTEVVMSFFSDLKIKGVRLPKDGDAETGKLKGFGYADFEDRASLIEALTMNDNLLNGRKIRVDLATHAGRGGERDRGFGDRGGSRYGDKDDGDDRTAGDWRSGPPPAPRDNDRNRGYDRGGYDSMGSDRRGDRDGNRGFDRYEPPKDRGGYDRDDRRDSNRGYGFGRDGDRDRGGYGGDRDRRDGGGYREDRRDRGGYDRGYDRRRSPEPPRERRPLQLSKRSDKPESSEESEASTRRPAIFGAAKPVDTAKKEAEIEQKLQEKPTKTGGTSSAIFGEAKPVDTAKKEAEIELKLQEKPTKTGGASSAIFGGAKPVDTSKKRPRLN